MIISSEIENMEKVDNLIKEIKSDQVWSILDRSDSIWSKKNWKLKIWWYISMIISSEIENMEKVDNLIKAAGKCQKAF